MLEPGRRGLSRWRKPEDRLAELKRMRAIATLLLVTMTVVFILTTIMKSDQVWIPYVRAFAEAAMVGACADWFAVVALFRRPFGLPIPHTAIVPANQQRIGESLGRFITNNFLTRKAISRQLVEIDIAGSVARWLGDPVNARKLAAYGGRFLPEILKKVPRHRLGEFVGSLSRRGVDAIPAALLASRVLETLWAQGQTQALLDSVIEHGRTWLASHEDFIQQKVMEKSSRWVPKWLDAMLAKRIMTGLLATIEEMRNPNHPWRIELKKAIEKVVVDLATDQDMIARGEALKAQWFAHPTFLAQIEFLWVRIEEAFIPITRVRPKQSPPQSRPHCLASPNGWMKKQLFLRWPIVVSGLCSCVCFFIGALKSDPTLPESWKPGMPQRSSVSWNSRLEKIFNMFASMEPWSAGSSDFLFSPRQGGSNRFR